jgi:hypothetical protein
MTPEELSEQAEEAHHSGQKAIGLTTAITAVLLAVATLLGHRAHTEEIVLQGERNTQWVNFDTKRMQRVLDEDLAALSAALPGSGREVAEKFRENARVEREGEPARQGASAKPGTDEIRKQAIELDNEMKLTQRRASFYDASELFLEISIVLCSISLLAGTRLYWRLSFITTAMGIAVAIYGAVLR